MGRASSQKKKKKTEEVLGQVVWIRALRCVVWKEGGQRGQEVSPRPVQKAGQTVRLIRNACRSFLGSRVDSAAGKDGRERGGNGQVFLVCHTDSPPPPCLKCSHCSVTSFLHAPLPSQPKQTGWDESATTWLTLRFYCSFPDTLSSELFYCQQSRYDANYGGGR